MTSFEDNVFIFCCDFDHDKNRWWFEDRTNERMYFVSGNVAPEDYECIQATEELIKRHLKVIYPTYDFYDYDINHNGRMYNPKTKQLYPTFALTITVHYRKLDETQKKLDKSVNPDELLKVPEEIFYTPEELFNSPEEFFKVPVIKVPVKTSKKLVNIPKPKEGYFSFSCDYDYDEQTWWFKDDKGITYYIKRDPRKNIIERECDYATKELIDRFLKPAYPKYDFYRYHTNLNAQIYNPKTKEYSPPYHFSVGVNYRYY